MYEGMVLYYIFRNLLSFHESEEILYLNH